MKRLGKTAAVITTKGSLFCLSQRTNAEMFRGYWQYAGGREDSPGESHLDIALRELREEMELEVQPHRLQPLGENPFDDDCESCALFHLELCEDEHPKWVEKDKCSEWRWFTIERVRNLKLIPGTLNFVEEVYRKRLLNLENAIL